MKKWDSVLLSFVCMLALKQVSRFSKSRVSLRDQNFPQSNWVLLTKSFSCAQEVTARILLACSLQLLSQSRKGDKGSELVK